MLYKIADFLPFINDIENVLGFVFKNKLFIQEAFIHASFCHGQLSDHSGLSNQRLEILGDAVLNMIITDLLFARFDEDEGFISQMRASLVKAEACFWYASSLLLDRWVVVSKSLESCWDRHKKSVLSDLIEAVFGAIYKDAGLDVAKQVYINLFGTFFEQVCTSPPKISYRERLQHLLQKYGKFDMLRYDVKYHEGAGHMVVFSSDIIFNNIKIAEGKGASKKQAKESASEEAFRYLMSNKKSFVDN